MNTRIQIWLAAQGRTGRPLVDYTLVDPSDGTGPRIEAWDVATLGPPPTRAALDAITPAQIAALAVTLKEAESSRLADDLIARSVARATWEELRKYELRNNQTAATWAEFRDAIKTLITERL